MNSNEESFQFPFISQFAQPSRRSWKDCMPLRRRAAQLKDFALCIDDDPLSLRLVEHLLKKHFTVISCLNVDAAVKAVKRHRIDLLICDYHLNDRFTGSQAYELLRDTCGYRPRHRILITSYPSPEIEAESRAIGFDSVFSKPLRKEFQSHCIHLPMPELRNPMTAG